MFADKPLKHSMLTVDQTGVGEPVVDQRWLFAESAMVADDDGSTWAMTLLAASYTTVARLPSASWVWTRRFRPNARYELIRKQRHIKHLGTALPF
jgi:hypothetical protein